MPGIVGILLAAGQSIRFGKENKLLAPLADGTPLVIAAAQPLQAALSRVIAVIPNNAPELSELLTQHDIETIHCPESTKGMGASIACGVHASSDASGWLISLADMPSIPAKLIQEIAAVLDSGAPLVRPIHNKQPGHPVGFSHAFRNELLQLKNDIGGQAILKRHASSLHFIPAESNYIYSDVDTKTNLEEFWAQTNA